MNAPHTSEPVVIRARKQPYVVFGIILVPMVILMIGAAVHSRTPNNIGAIFIPICILLGVYAYFYSLKLILAEDKIVYTALLRSKELPLSAIRSIELGPRVMGVPGQWSIYSKSSGPPLLVNVANFEGSKLKIFLNRISEREPGIKIAIPLFHQQKKDGA